MTALGTRIRELRKSHGLKAEELADVVSVNRRTLLYYETGEREPSLGQLVLLADYFHVSVDYLVGRASVKTEMAEPNKIFVQTLLEVMLKRKTSSAQQFEDEVRSLLALAGRDMSPSNAALCEELATRLSSVAEFVRTFLPSSSA